MYFVEAAILGWPEVSGIRAPKAAPATTVVIDTMTRPTSARRKWACLHRTYHERCQPEDVHRASNQDCWMSLEKQPLAAFRLTHARTENHVPCYSWSSGRVWRNRVAYA